MGNGKVKILIIEDDRVDQLAFKRLFEDKNYVYKYCIAGSISEAKKALKEEIFDVVVTDYFLGDGTVLDIFDDAKGTPIIVITGSGDEEIAVNALKSGAYDYLIKDMDHNYFKVFPITVENVIKRKKAEEAKIQKEKLQGVIEMAGAACHELNQPLQAISGYSELLMMEIDENNPLYEMINEIKNESTRMGKITRKLNNITRYATTDYVIGKKIIDIYKASERNI